MNMDWLTPDAWIQLASLAIYLAAIIWGILAFIDIRQSPHSRAVKYIGSGLTILSMTTAILFIAAQIPWIIDQQWKQMSTAEMMTWLMYDWFNGLVHLGVVLAVRAFMRWEIRTPCQSPKGICPSNYIVQREHQQDQALSSLTSDIVKLQTRVDDLAIQMTDKE